MKNVMIYCALLLALSLSAAQGASNGKLQIHYMNVGQGDGAILISPQGQSIMFDNGPATGCVSLLKYLGKIGITEIDYHVVSHYHLDHFGCSKKLFSQIKLNTAAYDRGVDFKSDSVASLKKPGKNTYYSRYVTSVGKKRVEAAVADELTLDGGSAQPVKIRFVAMNGNRVSTINENDLSLVATVEFGKFRTAFGGDLSGFNQSAYQDIETSVAPLVGRIDIYKVNHHCSRYSSNKAWLAETRPTIAIMSVGLGNGHGHPTSECLGRLRAAGVQKSYWTTKGGGATPRPKVDVIGGNIVVEVEPEATTYRVISKNKNVDEYPIAAAN